MDISISAIQKHLTRQEIQAVIGVVCTEHVLTWRWRVLCGWRCALLSDVGVHCEISLGFAQIEAENLVELTATFRLHFHSHFPSPHRALPSHERVPGCVRWASLSWRHASVTLSLITPQDVHSALQMSHSAYLSPTHRAACFAYGNKEKQKSSLHVCILLLFLPLMITQSSVITLLFKLERALDAFVYC